MKKIIVVLCILFLILLLIPYPGKVKDGGSIHYDAILYDVYVVHSGPIDPEEMNYVEGVIIEIFGIQVYNNTNPHIDNFGDYPN